MRVYKNVLELVGKTPLVKINHMLEENMADIYAKMENLNPGGSVKDRMAVHMVNKAEERGDIKPGGTLVESTSGNTGLGLAMAAAIKGYRSVFTIPDKMSQEKIDMLKAYGAEVIVTPTDVAHDAPESYVEVAKRIARETPNAFYTNQYHNMDNPESHYLTTGPEIWEDTDGKIDCLVASMGTGGTVSGAAKYLKEKAAEANRDIRVVCADPFGSIYSDVFYSRPVGKPKTYKVEGIGHDFMVGTLDMSVIDEVMNVSDKDSFLTARRLAREEGIFVGGSTGTTMFAALKVAKELGPGKIVVMIVCDSGDRYISKQFSDEWMKDMCFLESEKGLGTVKDLLSLTKEEVIYANVNESISSVAARMSSLGISQMPIIPEHGKVSHMVQEVDLLHALITSNVDPEDAVQTVAKPLEGRVYEDSSLSVLQPVFDQNSVAVVVNNSDDIVGIISKIDVVRFLTSRG